MFCGIRLVVLLDFFWLFRDLGFFLRGGTLGFCLLCLISWALLLRSGLLWVERWIGVWY